MIVQEDAIRADHSQEALHLKNTKNKNKKSFLKYIDIYSLDKS